MFQLRAEIQQVTWIGPMGMTSTAEVTARKLNSGHGFTPLESLQS